MIPECSTVADVGCDHGYLSIALLENKRAQKVIAMDVNKGPLSKAKENVTSAGFESDCELRLSDGLKALSHSEAEVICICGMVGALIGRFVIDENKDYLIVYSIGCGFAIMGFIICLITKEDKFEYKPIGELDTNKYEDSKPEDEKLI